MELAVTPSCSTPTTPPQSLDSWKTLPLLELLQLVIGQAAR